MKNKKLVLTITLSSTLILGLFIHLHPMNYDMTGSGGVFSNSKPKIKENGDVPKFLTHPDYDSDLTAIQSVSEDKHTNSKISRMSDFPVSLTGRFSDEGVDTDSDSLFNMIRIKVEVNSTQLIDCFVIFDLLWDFGYIESFPLQIITIPPGIHNITYEFNPKENYYLINNTSFIFEFLSLKYSYGGDGSFLEAHSFYTSHDYHYTEFNQPEAFFTGQYNVLEVDTDEDGLIDYLKIITNINITISGDFTVSLNFEGEESDYSTWESVEQYYDPGPNIVNFSFDLGDVYTQKINTSYVIRYVDIYYQFDRVYFTSTDYSTRYYIFTEFDPPYVYLTRTFSDQGLDMDTDGLFNYLSIMTQLNVTTVGFYRVSVLLISKETDNYRQWGEVDQEWTKGVHNVSINFEIVQNYSQPWNDSFILHKILIRDSQDQIILEEWFQYTTTTYHSSRFDPPIVIFTGKYWDFGNDTDKDGLYNILEITAEINVTEGIEEYYFTLTISDPRDIFMSVTIKLSLEIGFHSIWFHFDSYNLLDLYNNSGSATIRFDVALIHVYGSGGFFLEQKPGFTTSDYYFSSFDSANQVILPTTSDETTFHTTSLPKESPILIDARFLLFGVIVILLLFTLNRSRK